MYGNTGSEVDRVKAIYEELVKRFRVETLKFGSKEQNCEALKDMASKGFTFSFNNAFKTQNEVVQLMQEGKIGIIDQKSFKRNNLYQTINQKVISPYDFKRLVYKTLDFAGVRLLHYLPGETPGIVKSVFGDYKQDLTGQKVFEGEIVDMGILGNNFDFYTMRTELNNIRAIHCVAKDENGKDREVVIKGFSGEPICEIADKEYVR